MRKAVIAIVLVCLIVVAAAYADNVTKKKLPRDSVYYEIVNDAGDHGNYIETYHIPTRGDVQGETVYCVVYSDQIQKYGGGAGVSCNWDAFNHGQPGDRGGWLHTK